MSEPAEKRFDEIIERALDEADSVECSIEEYVENLRAWVSPFGPIAIRIDAAKGKCRRGRR